MDVNFLLNIYLTTFCWLLDCNTSSSMLTDAVNLSCVNKINQFFCCCCCLWIWLCVGLSHSIYQWKWQMGAWVWQHWIYFSHYLASGNIYQSLVLSISPHLVVKFKFFNSLQFGTGLNFISSHFFCLYTLNWFPSYDYDQRLTLITSFAKWIWPRKISNNFNNLVCHWIFFFRHMIKWAYTYKAPQIAR